jgi:hypothetical protein
MYLKKRNLVVSSDYLSLYHSSSPFKGNGSASDVPKCILSYQVHCSSLQCSANEQEIYAINGSVYTVIVVIIIHE